MKKKYLLLSFVIVGVLTMMNTTKVVSKIAFTPVGSCGDPTTNLTCIQSGCHGGTAQAVTAQDLALTIGTDTSSMVALDNNFKYTPSQTYYVSFKILAHAYAYGFQMTTLDASNTMAGSYTALTPANTKLLAGSPSYIGHKNANPAVSSWLFQWTAPATATGGVTFYYAFNPGDSANYVNTLPGANIFVGTTTVHVNNTGIENIASNVSNLEVYPNPVNGAFSLSFDVIKGGTASAYIYTIDGKMTRQLFYENLSGGNFNRNYSIESLPAGIYLVQLNINGATVTKKIVKE